MKSISIIFLAISCIAFNQKREFEWYPSKPQTTIPDHLKNEKAVYVFKQISFDYLNDRTTSITSIEKIKILNNQGLEEYNKAYIPASLYPHLETFSARVIKPDGTTIELESSDIIVEGISSNRDEPFYNHAKYVLKGAEVGDEIETIYIANFNRIYLGADVSLGSNLHCLHSMVSITNYLDMEIGFSNNGFDIKHKVKENESLGNVIVWEEENIGPEQREIYSVNGSNVPYCSFAPNLQSLYNPQLKGKPYDWTDLAGTINSIYGSKRFNNKLVKYLKSETTWWDEEKGFTYKLINMLDLINGIPHGEQDQSTYFELFDYIENNEIDYEGRINFIAAFLDKENVPYDIGFTRDKYDGPLTVDLTNIFQLERLFFRVFHDGQEIYVFPSVDELKLYVNEIPFFYEGNNAILIERQDSDDIQTVKFVNLPYSDHQFNFRNTRTLFSLDIENNSISVQRKDKNSGALSYDSRWYLAHKTDKEVLGIMGYDTNKVSEIKLTEKIEQRFYPVEMNLESLFLIEDALTPIDSDSIYAIDFEQILLPRKFAKSEGLRETNFYPLFSFKDKHSVYIQSDKKMIAINAEELATTIENSFGSFKLEVIQVNDNVVKIDYIFSIDNQELAARDYGYYVELFDQIEELRHGKLILSIK